MNKHSNCSAKLAKGTTSFCPACMKEAKNFEKKSKSKIKAQKKIESIPEVVGEVVNYDYSRFSSDVLLPERTHLSEGNDKKQQKNFLTIGFGFATIIYLIIELYL